MEWMIFCHHQCLCLSTWSLHELSFGSWTLGLFYLTIHLPCCCYHDLSSNDESEVTTELFNGFPLSKGEMSSACRAKALRGLVPLQSPLLLFTCLSSNGIQWQSKGTKRRNKMSKSPQRPLLLISWLAYWALRVLFGTDLMNV